MSRTKFWVFFEIKSSPLSTNFKNSFNMFTHILAFKNHTPSLSCLWECKDGPLRPPGHRTVRGGTKGKCSSSLLLLRQWVRNLPITMLFILIPLEYYSACLDHTLLWSWFTCAEQEPLEAHLLPPPSSHAGEQPSRWTMEHSSTALVRTESPGGHPNTLGAARA